MSSLRLPKLRSAVRRKELGEKGQGMAEYIIIVILVAIIVLVAIRIFGKSIFNQFGNATNQIDTLGGGGTTN